MDMCRYEQLADCLKEGAMRKRGGGHKSWKRRWFVLSEKRLYYFADTKLNSKPKGVIYLEEGYTAEVLEDKEIMKKLKTKAPTLWQLAHPTERTYMFCCDNETDMQLWIRALLLEIFRQPLEVVEVETGAEVEGTDAGSEVGGEGRHIRRATHDLVATPKPVEDLPLDAILEEDMDEDLQAHIWTTFNSMKGRSRPASRIGFSMYREPPSSAAEGVGTVDTCARSSGKEEKERASKLLLARQAKAEAAASAGAGMHAADDGGEEQKAKARKQVEDARLAVIEREREEARMREEAQQTEAARKRRDRWKAEANKLEREKATPQAARTEGRTSTGLSKVVAKGVTARVDPCEVCGKRVYFSERLAADGMLWHKFCFRCDHCNRQLTTGNYASLEGKLYCKPHFKQLFKLKGNYASGFGALTPEQRWKGAGQEDPTRREGADERGEDGGKRGEIEIEQEQRRNVEEQKKTEYERKRQERRKEEDERQEERRRNRAEEREREAGRKEERERLERVREEEEKMEEERMEEEVRRKEEQRRVERERRRQGERQAKGEIKRETMRQEEDGGKEKEEHTEEESIKEKAGKREERKEGVTTTQEEDMAREAGKDKHSRLGQGDKKKLLRRGEAAAAKTDSGARGGGGRPANVCLSCGKRVYPLEKIEANGGMYHKGCFRCKACGRVMSLGAFAAIGGEVYCTPHYLSLFKSKGNYNVFSKGEATKGGTAYTGMGFQGVSAVSAQKRELPAAVRAFRDALERLRERGDALLVDEEAVLAGKGAPLVSELEGYRGELLRLRKAYPMDVQFRIVPLYNQLAQDFPRRINAVLEEDNEAEAAFARAAADRRPSAVTCAKCAKVLGAGKAVSLGGGLLCCLPCNTCGSCGSPLASSALVVGGARYCNACAKSKLMC